MSFFAETLRPLFATGIIKAKPRDAKSFQDFLCSAKHGFSPQFNAGTWTLDFSETTRLAGYLAFDSNRMACAAFQTFEMARVDMRDGHRMPWALIQAYYAAFYAGHSVLCVFGSNSKHLDGEVLAYVNRLLNIQQIARLTRGLHLVTQANSGQALTLSPRSKENGGTHGIFWELFRDEIRRLGSAVLSVPGPLRNTQACSTKLDDLLTCMAGPNSGKAWLSEVRNQVQYKHERDVWWFTKSSRRPDAIALSGIMNGWRGDPMDIELHSQPDELRRFVASCTFLVSLCHAVLEEVGRCGKFRATALGYPNR